MGLAEFLFDVGTWMIALGITVFVYLVLLQVLFFFMGGRK